MQRLINGHAKNEILEMLTKPFPEKCFDTTNEGFPYLPIDVLYGRLNDVVGILNYDFDVTAPSFVTVGESMAVSVKGTLTLKYDDDTVCISKSALGAENIPMLRSDKSVPVSLENSIRTVESNALTACCKNLGIGVGQLREKRKALKNKNYRTDRTAESNTYCVKFTGTPTPLGYKGYKVPAVTSDKRNVMIMIWADIMAIIQEKVTFDKFIEIYKKNALTFLGTETEGTFRNAPETQITIKDFCEK